MCSKVSAPLSTHSTLSPIETIAHCHFCNFPTYKGYIYLIISKGLIKIK